MDKRGKITFFVLIVSLIAVSFFSIYFVMAQEQNEASWDDLNYENNDLLLRIDEDTSAELKSHKSVDEVKEVSPGDSIVMWYEFDSSEIYPDGIGDVEFKNVKTGGIIEKDYSFVYLSEEQYNVPSFSCDDVIQENGSVIRDCLEDGTISKTRNVWEDYNSKDIPLNGVIGLRVHDLKFGEHLDAVWTLAGKKADKHAEFLVVNVIHVYNATSSTNDETYNFTGVSFGSADSTRAIVVGLWAREGTVIGVDDVDIAGYTTQLINTTSIYGNVLALYYANVPTGTSGYVYFDYNATAARMGMGVWALYNLSGINMSRYDSDHPSVLIDVTENGGVVGISGPDSTGAPSYGANWTGLTRNFDQDTEGGNEDYISGASMNFTTAQTNYNVTAFGPTGNTQSMLVASFLGTPVTNYTITFNLTDSFTGEQIDTSKAQDSFDISCDNGYVFNNVENPNTTTNTFSGTVECTFSDLTIDNGATFYRDKNQTIAADSNKTVEIPMSRIGGLTEEEHNWLEAVYECVINNVSCGFN